MYLFNVKVGQLEFNIVAKNAMVATNYAMEEWKRTFAEDNGPDHPMLTHPEDFIQSVKKKAWVDVIPEE